MSRFVTFRTNASRYAIPADLVSEVAEAGELSERIPDLSAERSVALTRVRGRWVPVVELDQVVPDAPRGALDSADSALLIFNAVGGRFALHVEELDEIICVDGDSESIAVRATENVLAVDGELIRLVDPGQIFGGQGYLIAGSGDPMDETQAQVEPLKFVTFQIAGEEFGVDVMRVREVLTTPAVRAVPKSPDFVEGVVGVRDRIVPVIDMRKRFSLSERQEGQPGRTLVVDVGDGRVGMVVDAVPGVVPLLEEEISAPPEFFKGLAGRYLQGIARHGERLIILLDVDEILTSDERIALQKMMNTAGDKEKQNQNEPASRTKRKQSRRKTKKKKKRSR